jgi:hypothetical protein
MLSPFFYVIFIRLNLSIKDTRKNQSGILSGAEAAKKSINYRSSSSMPKDNVRAEFKL